MIGDKESELYFQKCGCLKLPCDKPGKPLTKIIISVSILILQELVTSERVDQSNFTAKATNEDYDRRQRE